MKKSPFARAESTVHSQRLALESRLVFDGAMVATVTDIPADSVDNKPVSDNPSAAAPSAPPVDFFMDKTPPAVDYQPAVDSQDTRPAFAVEPTQTASPVSGVSGDYSTTLMVVDPRAENAAALHANPPANTQVIVLDATRDGFQQVSALLQGRHDVTRLDVISWNDGNNQWLGNKPLSSVIDSNVSNELMTWGDGFADNASIVFHGTGNQGSNWLSHIDALTGADTHWSQRIDVSPAQPHELIVVDTRIDNYQSLLASFNTNAEILYIDSGKDGIQQIADNLQGRTDISALHILSHGSQGSFTLGTSTLSSENINSYQNQLAAIGQSLTADGDILLYSCDVADGAAGVAFINQLANLTHADISASDDATGNAAKGGDWVLEYNTGNIEAVALADIGYQDLLAAPTIADANPVRSIAEDSSLSITGITVADVDGNNQTVTLSTANGVLTLATTAGLTGLSGNGTGTVSFSGTLLQVNAAINGMTFAPTANFNGTAILNITTNDGTTPITLSPTITVTSVYDAPVAIADAVGIVEDSVSVTGNVLTNDTVDTGQTKTVAALTGGTIGTAMAGQYGSLLLNADGSYTYTLDNTNTVVQGLGAGSAPLIDSFTYTMKDTTNTLSNSTSLTVSISGINDQPVITTTPISLSEPEDASQVMGVNSLLIDAGSNPIWTDSDTGTIMGVAITAAPSISANGMTGTWYYSTDSGANWTAFPAVSASNALLLSSATGRVQFVQDHSIQTDNKNSGSVSITYKAWDGSTGIAGNLTDTTASSPTSPYSSNSNTAILNVTPVNDPLYFAGSAALVNEHSSINLTGGFSNDAAAVLTGNLQVHDVDNSTAQILYRIEELPAKGTLTLNGAVLAVGSLFSQDNIPSIVYTPTVGELSADTTDRFYFTIRDGAGGVIGSDGKTGANPWAFLDITIKDVNAQVAVSGNTVTIAEDNINVGVPVIKPINLSMTDADDPGNLRTLTLTSLPTATFGTLEYWNGSAYQTATVGLVFTQAQLTDAVHPALRFTYNNTTEPTDVNGVLIPAQSHTSFTVHVEDNNALLPETTANTTVTIDITPANDNPVLTTSGLTVVQNSSNNPIGTGNLIVTDPDSPAVQRVYTLNVDANRGYLTLNGVRIGRGSTFTEAQLASGQLKYTTNDPYYSGTDSIQVFVTDGHGGQSTDGTINITITPDILLPTPPTNTNTPADSTGNSVSVTGTLKAVAPESLFFKLDNVIISGSGTLAPISYSIDSKPAHGDVYLNGVKVTYGAAGVGTAFSQANINAGNVVYLHDGSEADLYATPFLDTLTITAVSGTAKLTQNIAVTITPVDDAPTITQTVSSYTLNEAGTLLMEQNADGSDGLAIADFGLTNVTNAKKLTAANFTDHDNDTIAQLTYLVQNVVGGSIARWNGSSWNVVFSFSVADLNAGNIAYFHSPASDVTAPNNTTMTGSVSVYLIDGATVGAGDVLITPPNITETGSLTINDGTNTISVAKNDQMRSPSRTVTFTVNDVNDAPVATNTSFTVTEFSAGIAGQTDHIQILNTSLVAASDADTGNGTWTYTLTALPTNGKIQKFNGTAWVDMAVNDTFTYANLSGGALRYLNTGRIEVTTGINWTASQDSFKFTVNDGETISNPKPLGSNEATVSIFLRPTNQPPVVVNNGPATVPEGGAVKITSALLGSADAPNSADIVKAVDPDHTRIQVQYRITGNVSHGQLYLGDPTTGVPSTQLSVGSVVTLEDLQLGKVWYQHDGSDASPYSNKDSFNYAISDASGMTEPTATFIININPVNDAPVVSGLAGGATFVEGDTGAVPNVTPIIIDSNVTLSDYDLANNNADFRNGSLTVSNTFGSKTFDQLSIKDVGTGAGQIGYNSTTGVVTYAGVQIGTVNTAGANGVNGNDLTITFSTTANPSLTTAAIKALLQDITFLHTQYDNAVTGTRTLNYTLVDGGGTTSYTDDRARTFTGADTWTGTATVIVAAANDRPILTAHTGGGNLNLGSITEDNTAAPTTFQVSSFTTPVNGSADATHTGIADIDTGAVRGIAITALTNAATGHWEYSANGSTGWTTITGVSPTNALLLSATDFIRFVPDGQNGGTATFTYQAWDTTSGSPRTYVNPTSNATQNSAFSVASDTAALTVTSINDAPINTGNLTLTSTVEDTLNPAGAAINTLTGLGFQDVDTGATLGGVAIIGNTATVAEGVWQYSTSAGNWNNIGTVADGATALVLAPTTLVRFVPALNYNGTPTSLVVRAIDNTYAGAFSTTTGGIETRVTTDSGVNGTTTAISATTNTIATTVTPVNDTPTITADKTINTGVNEGSALVISNGINVLVTVDDIEAVRNEGAGGNQGKVSVTITVPNGLTHGKVTLGSIPVGLSITAGANNTNTLTITGTLTDVNAALNGLSFTPGADTNATETVTVTINDLGNNGTTTGTGALTALQTITINNIVPSNNAPTVTAPLTVTATEDTAYTFSGGVISIADVDVRSTDIVALTLNLSSAGTFKFSTATGLYSSYTDSITNTPYPVGNPAQAAGGDVVVYGTIANLNAALNGLIYTPTSNLNSVNVGSDYIGGTFAGKVHLDITVNDRGYGNAGAQGVPLDSIKSTVEITVNPVNDAPGIIAPTIATPTYIEQAAAITIGTGVTVTDAIDDTQLFGATVTIGATNFRTGDTLAANVGATAITAVYNAATRTLTLSGVDSIANYNAVLQSVTFSNLTNDAPTSGGATSRTITWQATDNNADSAANGKLATLTVTSSINIIPVSDAPAGTNNAVTTNEDTAYTFTTANFGFSDPLDSPADTLNRVLITTLPANGTLRLNGSTVVAGDYILATDITGGKLTYTPVANANGTAYTSFTFQVEDTGSAANGGIILDQSPNTITINVTPLNDAPVLTATASNPSVTENAGTGTGTSVDPVALFTGASIDDIDLSTTAALNSTVFGAGSITVSFTDTYVTGDVLFVNGVLPAGVSISATDTGVAKALTINLATTTTVAEVNSILAAISYKSSSDNPTVNDTDNARNYQIVVNDGNNSQGVPNAGGAAALNSNIISGTLTITRTNDAPVVDLNGVTVGTDNAVTWTEGSNVAHVAVAINPNATVADTDNTNMTQLVMQVGGVLDGNNEVLNIGGINFLLNTTVSNVAAGGFLVSYNSGTGTFTILPTPSSVASASSFQTLIQGITYINNTDNVTAGNRTVTFNITDAGFDNSTAVGGELSSNIPTTTINVVRTNDQPVITNLNAVSYFENAINTAAAIIDGSITLTDIDSPNYNGGVLTISGLIAGQDTVSLPISAATVLGNVQINGGNVEYYDGSSWVVIGTQSGGAGVNFVVSFNASATPAIVQRVIENLTFANSSNNPTLTRTLTYALNDGGAGTVQTATVGVTIKLDNDAPVMTAATLGGTYTEQNATPLQFISGAISVSDPDSPLNFYINTAAVAGSLTVALDGYQTGDTLSVLNQGTAAGQIGVTGTLATGLTIKYGNVTFATTSANSGIGSNLVINFTSATATPAAVQALLARLTFSNTTNDDPTVNNTDPSRVFTVTLNDGGNTKDATSSTTALTATLTGTINLTAVNDKPVITPAGTPAAYTENAVATVVDNTLIVTDVDDTQMNGGTISITGNFLAGDVLAVTNIGNISSSYSGATGILTLSGLDSIANYQAVLRSLTYLNSTDDPTDNTSKTTRTLTYSLTDANSDAVGAATSLAATKTINVTPLQDAPVLTGGGTLTYTEQAAAAVIDASVTVSSDADDTQMSGATITLSAGYTAGDILSFTAQNGITVVSNSGGVLVLTGTTTLANYTAALRSISFNSTSDTPTIISNSRTVTWQVRDANSDAAGVASSNTVTSTINILALNDTPVLTALGNTVSFTEVGTAVVLNNAVTVADVDLSPLSGGAGNYNGTTLTLMRNGGANAEDVFSSTGTLATLTQGGNVSVGGTTIGTVTSNSAGTLVLTFNANATGALVNSALQQIAYRNNSTTPSASVQINWLFNDQNPNITGGGTAGTGQDQGGGGVLTASGSTTINIDRLPTAKPDTNNIAENALNVTGNVITGATTADDQGDPAATVTGVATGTQVSTSGSVNTAITGSYGSLTLDSTGAYTYTLDNANPLVNKLLTGQTLTETYSYTITDADGDTSTTTLIITINGVTDGAPTVVPVDGNGGLTGQAEVFEKGLVAPTDNSQTTTGTLTVTAPDGMASVTIGGTTFTVAQLAAFSVGSPSAGINTGEGTLKVTGFIISTGATSAPTAGTLSYTYTLNATQAHSGGAAVTESVDTIALVVTDATTAANTSTGTLTVRIVDDTPTANNDTNSITENFATTTGNIFAAGSGGDVADRLGADVTATPVTGVASGTQASTSGNVNTPVAGSYGSLMLNATGGYTYTLDNSNAAVNALRTGQTLTDTYSYTITDADGDTSTATLTITINGTTDGAPVITPVDGNGAATGQAEVYEKGLVTVADTSETTTGTLTVSAPDGMASVTIGGTTFTVAQLAAFSVGSPSAGINTGEGTLKVTGFIISTGAASAPTAGTLSYSYTLNAPQPHTGIAAVRENIDTIALIVTDATTAATQATGTLTVRIVDDTPTANADVNSIAEDTATTTGNVFAAGSGGDVADRLGADVTATPVTGVAFGTSSSTSGNVGSAVAGNYGSLTLNADGSYTYTLDNTNPLVNKLLTGDTLLETYSYTITDADGDTSTTTLKITINGNTDNIPSIVPNDMNGAITGHVSVRESGLTSGADTSETTTGTLQLSALDGLQGIKVAGTSITLAQLGNLGTTPITITTPKGTITLTGYNSTANVGGVSTSGTLSYTYTLTQVQNTPAAAENTDDIPLSITNAGGNTITNTLIVQIVDDTPTANADVNSVNEGNTAAATTTSGNVFATGNIGDVADRIGADVVTNPVTGVAFGTQTSTSGNVNSAVAGLYGSLTLNATGGYTYTLDNTNPTVNALLTGQTLSETYSYTITDADGDTSTTTLTITINGITDSTPEITPIDGNNTETGQATVFEKGLVAPKDGSQITTGTVSVSAPDGMASVTIGGTTFTVAQLATFTVGSPSAGINTGEGTLVVTGFNIVAGPNVAPTAGTLSYRYTLNASQPHTGGSAVTESTDRIPLVVTDNSSLGNSATSTLIVRIVDDTPTAKADTNSVIEGTTLATTTTQGNVFGTIGASAGDVADRIGADTTATPITGVSFAGSIKTVGSAFNSAYGSLTLNANGTYLYALDNTNATVNALGLGQTLSETFSYTITDADGDTSTTTLTITINGRNDAPIAVNDIQVGISGQAVIINVLGNDRDPENNINPATVRIVGTAKAGDSLEVAGEGIWSVNPLTGAITFTPFAGFTADPTPISYTVTDRAGLTSNPATVTVDYPQTPPSAVDNTVTAVTGKPITITVLDNDSDPENDINPTTLHIVGTANAGDSLVVAGQGTWSVDVSTGTITFTPNLGFTGSPTPISYTVSDNTGLMSNAARVTVIYPPVIITDTGTSGSLIMLSNPDKTDSFSKYNEQEKKETFENKFKPDNQLPPAHLSLYVPIRHHVISLTGSLRDQVVLELERYSFSVPRWMFRHTDPNEQLEFEAARPDGSSLPEWLTFNPKTLKFSGVPPKGAYDERVMVTARDTYGNEVHATFNVHVNRERMRAGVHHKVFEKHKLNDKRAVGKAGLSEQIHAMGKLNKLQESRALLDSFKSVVSLADE